MAVTMDIKQFFNCLNFLSHSNGMINIMQGLFALDCQIWLNFPFDMRSRRHPPCRDFPL